MTQFSPAACRLPEGVSRRDFFKLTALSVAAPLLPDWGTTPARRPVIAPAPALGRITIYRTQIRATAAPDGAVLGTYSYDDVISVLGAVETQGLWSHNNVWYQTPDGYVYSSFVQPVENVPQPVEWSVPPQGFWAEVSVPYVDARGQPDEAAWRSYRLYYATVYHVVNIVTAADGTGWYGLADGLAAGPNYYVPAHTMHHLTEADLAPISPGADKAIKVTLSTQTLEAFEGTQRVFAGRVASGANFNVGGVMKYYYTPQGRHHVLRKAMASHMIGGTRGQSDYYDLPGVPYCTYITASRVAIHGAYWHNDFGHPRSHGCLNMLPSESRWIYRWTEPAVPYDSRYLDVREGGTLVEVVA